MSQGYLVVVILSLFKFVSFLTPAKPAPFRCGFSSVKKTALVVCRVKVALDFPSILTVSDISRQSSTLWTSWTSLIKGRIQATRQSVNYNLTGAGVLSSLLFIRYSLEAAADIEQLSRFSTIGYCDDSTIVYLQHPCIILTALEVLGYKVVASSSTSIKQDYNEYMWTMRKEFSEPEPDTVVKKAGMARNILLLQEHLTLHRYSLGTTILMLLR
ncbi:hypothetical protein ALC56_12898 [Trachymyrmex septentrionalis]|uniref:Reverse transcriptase domain-containing protein n=1 Tax=Trachymyrmex septentrionalis TaxID=34720 RepID=A0A195EY57_9HYME|nr:hypothetical protein ALC56_12898 [Trachymyrmex septentrionalis]